MPIWPLLTPESPPNGEAMLKNRITEIRNARGLSIEELAAKADMSPSYVSRMARGERNISLRTLEKLALALDCSPEDLMGGEAPLPHDIADIWAAIPADRRELAKQVLESFVTKGVDETATDSVTSRKKK